MKKTIKQLEQELEELRAENEQLKIHPSFGILTRSAFEIEKRKYTAGQFVVFGDIDLMHELNAQHGYDVVDKKIYTALQLRASDLLSTSLRFSGDEIVFIISSGDPKGFCARVQKSFLAQGIMITLAFAKIENNDIDGAIKKAVKKVQANKARRIRKA